MTTPYNPEDLNQRRLINAVFNFANERYTKGWDYVVECYTPEELWNAEEGFNQGRTRTWGGVVRKLSFNVKLRNERMREVRNEIF